MKAFLPAAFAAEAPFWRADEQDLPALEPSVVAAEGGFAIGRGRDEPDGGVPSAVAVAGAACARTPGGVSAIVNLYGRRCGETVRPDPITNVLFSRSVIPMLRGTLAAGEHWHAQSSPAPPTP